LDHRAISLSAVRGRVSRVLEKEGEVNGYILGIDPGWSGGAAVIKEDGTLERVISFSGRTEGDIINSICPLIWDVLGSPAPVRIVYLESVHAMPKQGVCSAFKFGQIYGLLRGLIIGNARLIDVSPQAWQRSLGCLTHGDKNVSKAKAQQLFPGVKVTHATADALLIAYYGYTEERQIQPQTGADK
jgi:crossover junction endodeoxyribonuclease RuvC